LNHLPCAALRAMFMRDFQSSFSAVNIGRSPVFNHEKKNHIKTWNYVFNFWIWIEINVLFFQFYDVAKVGIIKNQFSKIWLETIYENKQNWI
jgi:hypothetical protein